MRLLRTLIIFDQGGIAHSSGWHQVYASLDRAINRIDFPEGSGSLTLRRKSRIPGTFQLQRNGVVYLKSRFVKEMIGSEGWIPEAQFDIEDLVLSPYLRLYPGLVPYQEAVTSKFGNFDFMIETQSGLRVAIEWETGNISSSHRSMNKLVTALAAGKICAGVLVLPSRALYEHLTDRIGNIGELSPYLAMWSNLSSSIVRGLLAIMVVEQDELTDDPGLPFLPTGNDGRARQGRARHGNPI